MEKLETDRTSSPERPKIANGLRDLSNGKDLLLCDVWGVLHNGVRFFPAAVEALCRFRDGGGTVILVTNAPVPEAQVLARLDRMGVPRTAFDGIATAGDVAVDVIVAAGCPPVFNIGPSDDQAIYQEAGRLGPRAPALVALEEAALVVCLGLDATGDRPEDYDGVLRQLRARELPFVCANPDIVVEVGAAMVWCAGAIAERYVALGGRVTQAGKPFGPIYARARAMAAALRGTDVATDRVLAIGDAMHTDVAGAAREGMESVLVTAGIHRARLHAGTDGGLDEAAFRQFMGEHATLPDAALALLAW